MRVSSRCAPHTQCAASYKAICMQGVLAACTAVHVCWVQREPCVAQRGLGSPRVCQSPSATLAVRGRRQQKSGLRREGMNGIQSQETESSSRHSKLHSPVCHACWVRAEKSWSWYRCCIFRNYLNVQNSTFSFPVCALAQEDACQALSSLHVW